MAKEITFPDGRKISLGFLNTSEGNHTSARDDGNGNPITDVYLKNAYNQTDDVLKAQIAGGNITSIGTVSTITTVSTVSMAYTVPKMVSFSETTANITTATPFVGTARDAGSTPIYNYYRLRIFSDQPLKIEVLAGSNATLVNNKVQATIEVPANTMTIEEITLVGTRYVGIRATNTGTATTTSVEILSSFVSTK